MTNERAADTMTRAMVTIHFDQPIEDAYLMMQQWGVRHLPVRDASGKIVGILADSDIFRAMKPTGPGFEAGQTVSDFMSWPALSIDESTPVAEVAEAMLTEKVGALLVTGEAGEPVGIVTTEDLLRVLQRMITQPARESAVAAVGGRAASARAEGAPTLSEISLSPVVREAMRELQSVGI